MTMKNSEIFIIIKSNFQKYEILYKHRRHGNNAVVKNTRKGKNETSN